ncbi:MAG: NADH-quinone oxidoreductase subunit M [Rhodobacteraceae bacterium]|nr:NADH-quinone oxidoreductase subunit M [Paracoccaceae bacterium]
MDSLLSVITFLPALAAIILLVFLRGRDEPANGNARILAFVATMATALVSIAIFTEFERTGTGFQMVEEYAWFAGWTYRVGVDGISIFLVLLTTLVMPVAVGASWSITTRVKQYMILFLMVETWVLLALTAMDLILFFVASEAALFTLLLLAGSWGSKGSTSEATKGYLYAVPGSFLLAMAFAAMANLAGTTDIVALGNHDFGVKPVIIAGLTFATGMQGVLFAALLIGFAFRMPTWPMHPWFNGVLAVAPVGVAVLMAALLTKLAAYGLVRFNIMMLPQASEAWAGFVVSLGALMVVYAGMLAIKADNLRCILSNLVIAGMGLALVGLFSLTRQALDGALLHLVSHGLIFAALFAGAGVLIDRVKSTDMDAFGGLIARMPVFCAVLMIFAFAALGVPGTSGFVATVLIMAGTVPNGLVAPFVALCGGVICAVAILRAYRRITFGDLLKQSLRSVPDLSLRECLMFTPLVVLVLGLGFFPMLILDAVAMAVASLQDTYADRLKPAQPLILTDPNIPDER